MRLGCYRRIPAERCVSGRELIPDSRYSVVIERARSSAGYCPALPRHVPCSPRRRPSFGRLSGGRSPCLVAFSSTRGNADPRPILGPNDFKYLGHYSAKKWGVWPPGLGSPPPPPNDFEDLWPYCGQPLGPKPPATLCRIFGHISLPKPTPTYEYHNLG